MINDYKNNSEKYKSRTEEELLRWFCQTAKFKLGDDNRKRYSKNLSTDRTLSVDENRILREVNFQEQMKKKLSLVI